MWWVVGYLVVGWLLVELCDWRWRASGGVPLSLGSGMWIIIGWPIVLPAAILKWLEHNWRS